MVQVEDSVLYCNVTLELCYHSLQCGFYFSKLTFISFRTIMTVQLCCYEPAVGITDGDQNYRAEKLRAGCVFNVAFH